MLPDSNDILNTLHDCCKSIGLDWRNPAEMEQTAISALIKDLEDASPTAWKSATLEMFAGLIQLRCLKNRCYIRKFDASWFGDNKDKTIYDLVVYLTRNAIDLD